MTDRLFSLCVGRFLARLSRWGYMDSTFMAIRVYEPFKSGYLHLHFVCNKRLPITIMRKMAKGTGIGRIHVRKAVSTDAGYLAKYLTKSSSQLGAYVRSYACWGSGWQKTTQRSIEIISDDTKLFKECYKATSHTLVRQEYESNYSWRKNLNKTRFIAAKILFAQLKNAQMSGHQVLEI